MACSNGGECTDRRWNLRVSFIMILGGACSLYYRCQWSMRGLQSNSKTLCVRFISHYSTHNIAILQSVRHQRDFTITFPKKQPRWSSKLETFEAIERARQTSDPKPPEHHHRTSSPSHAAMAASETENSALHGSCACERNQYTILIPPTSSSQASVFFDNSAANRTSSYTSQGNLQEDDSSG